MLIVLHVFITIRLPDESQLTEDDNSWYLYVILNGVMGVSLYGIGVGTMCAFDWTINVFSVVYHGLIGVKKFNGVT